MHAVLAPFCELQMKSLNASHTHILQMQAIRCPSLSPSTHC